MERRRRGGGGGGRAATGGGRAAPGGSGMEENTMAMLDTSGFKNSHHLNDDRLAFLEAVRCVSLLPDNGIAPTSKMFEAILQILKDEDSLDLIMGSYQLLIDLEKCFPRVSSSQKEVSESSSPSNLPSQLVVVEEAWSPFTPGLDNYNNRVAANKQPEGLVDPSYFHTLILEVTEVVKDRTSAVTETKFLRNMLLLQYLIFVLEGDFLPRNCLYQETANWTLLRESLLNILLGSRRITYKTFIKDCLSTMCDLSGDQEELSLGKSTRYSVEVAQEIDSAVALALPAAEASTGTALKKLLLMIMELDLSRSSADQHGHTTRTDGVRIPVTDIILDEINYNYDILYIFFQVFDAPKWKLKFIVQYFQKYIPKSSVRTRRSNGPVNCETFEGILKCLSNKVSAKSIIRKIGAEVVQLLLAHAFQAYLSLSQQHSSEGIHDMMEEGKGSALVEVCKNVVSAFTCLRGSDMSIKIPLFGKEALFTAATILSTKS